MIVWLCALLVIESDDDATTILANLISRIIEIQECICKINSHQYYNNTIITIHRINEATAWLNLISNIISYLASVNKINIKFTLYTYRKFIVVLALLSNKFNHNG